MNIFLIPSWYPSSHEPLTGIFTKEQAIYYGEINPDDRMIISLHGHGDYALKILNPIQSVSNLIRFVLENGETEEQVSGNVHEIYSPAIELPLILTGTCASVLLSAHRSNLDKALAQFGAIDVIHAHVAFPAGWIAYELSKEYQIPFVITEHMGPFPFQNPVYIRHGALTKWIREPLLHASERIAVSPSLARRMEQFGIPEPVVVPNVVDERRFTIAESSPVKERFVFFTLCSLSSQKGIPDLLHAAREVVQLYPNVSFMIGGGGYMEREYRGLASQLQLDGNVEWLGPVSRSDAPNLFQNCDAFVMPSLHETFGVVFAEAIACGKPVIATRCGGPEFIVNDANGILIDIGDRRALCKAMVSIVTDSSRFSPSAIRSDFLVRFSREAVSSMLRTIYVRVSSSKSRADTSGGGICAE